MLDQDVAAFRAFNRFHTRLVGALNDRLLASEFSLPQLRVLYEIAHTPAEAAPSASDLSGRLGMDPSHLGRIVADLVQNDIVRREPTAGNARRLALSLTDKGRETFGRIDEASNREAAALLKPLSDAERRDMVDAMRRIRSALGDPAESGPFVLRAPEPGDLGEIVAAHARLYAREYGWDQSFEALVADIVARFHRDFDSSCERAWIAERDGRVIGSVFVVRGGPNVAKLRLLYVDASARGHGLGQRLVAEAIRFARARGYVRMLLWTNDCLTSARRIYEAAGFKLIEEEAHHSFGHDLVGQTWALDL